MYRKALCSLSTETQQTMWSRILLRSPQKCFRRTISSLSSHTSKISTSHSNPFQHTSTPWKRRFLKRNFASKEGKPEIGILYGSQTGTAMGFAHFFRKQLIKTKHVAEVINPENIQNYDEELPRHDIFVMLLACFGQGEPTDNAKRFYDWLMSKNRENESTWISGKPFMVFGLGQSAHYPDRYQAVGKAVDKRWEELKGCRLLERGEGDDSKDIEDDFDEWSNRAIEAIAKWSSTQFKGKSDLSIKSDFKSAPESGENIIKNQETEQTIIASSEKSEPSKKSTLLSQLVKPIPLGYGSVSLRPFPEKTEVASITKPFEAPLIAIRNLQSSLNPRVYKSFTFDISESATKYSSGDYLGIFPANSYSTIDTICQLLNYDVNEIIDTKDIPYIADILGSTKISLLQLFSRFYDLTNPPRRNVLRVLSKYALSPAEKSKLEFLGGSTTLGKKEYMDYVLNKRISILDFLNIFSSIESMPLEEFLDILSPLQARYYSIASSPLVQPNSIEIACAIVDYPFTIEGLITTRRKGVTTDYLNSRELGDRVPLFVKRSLFRLPEDGSKPVIMICAGTGIAPFKGFIENRLAEKCQGKNYLFYGIGRKELDFLYRKEIEQWTNEGSIQLELAEGFAQSYWNFVQHRILDPDNSKLIWNLVDKEEAHVYLCGEAAHMGKSVEEALSQVAINEGGLSEEEGIAYWKQKELEGKFQMDVF